MSNPDITIRSAMPAARKKSTQSSRKRTKPTTRRKSSRRTRAPIIWLIVTLLVVIIVLLAVIFVLLTDQTDLNKPVGMPIEQQEPIDRHPAQREQQRQSDRFKVTYATEHEITAHVIAYRINVYKNGALYTSLSHQSAPIAKTYVKQIDGKTILTVEAVDYIDGQNYTEMYKYILDNHGNYTLTE